MENEVKKFRHYNPAKRFLFGILVILAGVVLLGINFGWLDPALKIVIFSWPMILIVVGLFQIAQRHYFPAFILFGIGVFFLLPKIAQAYPQVFPGIGSNFSAIYWPLLLIFAGIFILLQFIFPGKWNRIHKQWHHRWDEKWKENKESDFDYESKNISDGFDKNVVFGSVEHIFLEEEFPGGEINAVFGGVTLDLRKTKLAVGDTYLEINAVFGGITLYIPSDWYVVSRFDGVFGGFEDKRLLQEPTDKTRRLIIKGSCVFGGGEIR
ncbi:conserved membrane hypothetical protein [uncultured Paludibacter sp.]|uniref:LiaF transmembrane domain-containing protein n=1 Tax=uncultured Paludibacter sp. TaxID=497635 RepID=A0A653AIC5_9BACT|nr:conserved membrane hypothetical protein [uncultured Paludibacter sp.]